MKLVATAGAVLFLLGANAATAQVPAGPPHGANLLNDCGPNIKQYCAKVVPGGGRIIVCLKAHTKQLSPACRTLLPSLHAGPSTPPNMPPSSPGATPPK